MSKKVKSNKTKMRKCLREFVNHIINKDYALANTSFNTAAREMFKARVSEVLEEIK